MKIDIEKLQNSLPEIKILKDNFEKNGWHEETTYEHTLDVLKEYQKFESKGLLPFNKKETGRYSNYDLLKVVILLHDIAKPDTKVIDQNKETLFPKHEEFGAEKAKKMLEKLDFREDEIKYITSVIGFHGEPHKRLSDRENYLNLFADLKKQISDIFNETVFIAMVDTMGSKLGQKNPEDYGFRIKKYKEILNIKIR